MKKALVIIFALNKIPAPLTVFNPFTVITDHQAFRYIYQKGNVCGRLAGWLSFSAEYEFRAGFQLGKSSAPADYLFRVDLGSRVQPGHDEGDLACATVSTEDLSGLGPHLVFMATYLSGLTTEHLHNKARSQNALKFENLCNVERKSFRSGLRQFRTGLPEAREASAYKILARRHWSIGQEGDCHPDL